MVQMQPGTNIMQSSLNFIPYQTYTQHPNFQHATVLHEVKQTAILPRIEIIFRQWMSNKMLYQSMTARTSS
jgi:hypothetical protein